MFLYSHDLSLEGWARSWLFLRPSVRPSVPLLGEAQNICFCTILSEISENHLCILQYLATVALKTHHKIDTFFVKCSKHTIKWEAEIVNFNTSQRKSYVKSSNINTSQLKPYTFHSLTSLCPACLTFLSLSPLRLALTPLSFTLSQSWTPLIWIYSHASRQRAELEADYSSVRACVRPSVPLLGEAQNLCFCTILSETSENHLCILRYLKS